MTNARPSHDSPSSVPARGRYSHPTQPAAPQFVQKPNKAPVVGFAAAGFMAPGQVHTPEHGRFPASLLNVSVADRLPSPEHGDIVLDTQIGTADFLGQRKGSAGRGMSQ